MTKFTNRRIEESPAFTVVAADGSTVADIESYLAELVVRGRGSCTSR